MSEVLEVEVDGEVDDPGRSDGDGALPPWSLPAAIALTGVLALAVMIVVVLPALTGSEKSSPPPPGTRAASSVPPQQPSVPPDPRIDAARGALAAWGRFAADGNLDHLDRWFIVGGPQHDLLAAEASELAAGAAGRSPYDVRMKGETVESRGDNEVVVKTTAVWSRPAELDHEYTWELVLRLGEEGRWSLWTVRQGSRVPPTTATIQGDHRPIR